MGNRCLLFREVFFLSRTAWPVRAKESGKYPKQNHKLSQRPLYLQPGGPEEGSVLHPNLGPPTSVAISERPRSPEDLLPEAGGSRPSPTTYRKNVCLKHTVLMITLHYHVTNYEHWWHYVQCIRICHVIIAAIWARHPHPRPFSKCVATGPLFFHPNSLILWKYHTCVKCRTSKNIPGK